MVTQSSSRGSCTSGGLPKPGPRGGGLWRRTRPGLHSPALFTRGKAYVNIVHQENGERHTSPNEGSPSARPPEKAGLSGSGHRLPGASERRPDTRPTSLLSLSSAQHCPRGAQVRTSRSRMQSPNPERPQTVCVGLSLGQRASLGGRLWGSPGHRRAPSGPRDARRHTRTHMDPLGWPAPRKLPCSWRPVRAGALLHPAAAWAIQDVSGKVATARGEGDRVARDGVPDFARTSSHPQGPNACRAAWVSGEHCAPGREQLWM